MQTLDTPFRDDAAPPASGVSIRLRDWSEIRFTVDTSSFLFPLGAGPQQPAARMRFLFHCGPESLLQVGGASRRVPGPPAPSPSCSGRDRIDHAPQGTMPLVLAVLFLDRLEGQAAATGDAGVLRTPERPASNFETSETVRTSPTSVKWKAPRCGRSPGVAARERSRNRQPARQCTKSKQSQRARRRNSPSVPCWKSLEHRAFVPSNERSG